MFGWRRRSRLAKYIPSYISEGIWRQGIGSFVRISYVLMLCPVVICPCLCTSDTSLIGAAIRRERPGAGGRALPYVKRRCLQQDEEASLRHNPTEHLAIAMTQPWLRTTAHEHGRTKAWIPYEACSAFPERWVTSSDKARLSHQHVEITLRSAIILLPGTTSLVTEGVGTVFASMSTHVLTCECTKVCLSAWNAGISIMPLHVDPNPPILMFLSRSSMNLILKDPGDDATATVEHRG